MYRVGKPSARRARIDRVAGLVRTLVNSETLAAIFKHLRHEGEVLQTTVLIEQPQISALLRTSTQSPARNVILPCFASLQSGLEHWSQSLLIVTTMTTSRRKPRPAVDICCKAAIFLGRAVTSHSRPSGRAENWS